MARNRQRSKARQQQRREQRLSQRRESAALGGRPEEALEDDLPSTEQSEELELADLEVGAPPQDIGFSERTLRDEPPPPDFDTDDETLGEDGGVATTGPRGVRGAEKHERGRLIAFLGAACAAPRSTSAVGLSRS